jgi:cellulose synthase/poly-beta-1,6-N-acetylglucosamine synthase-like glycosyltransferase
MKPGLGRHRLGGAALLAITLLAGVVIPALAYTLLDTVIPGTIPNLQYLVATAFALTAMMTLLEARAAIGSHDEPETGDVGSPLELAELPTLTAIVSAYLPNERELVLETIVHLATEMRVAPGRLQIILAYNTPADMPDVEGMLESLAELNVAFTPLRVPGSRSKAENINAAMGHVRGEVTLLLDADHRPARDAAARALRWFGAGYDIVQGRCVIRESEANWLARVVAVEFEQIYAVAHAGRSLAFDTAVFGGTNGWWRTSVLREIGMDDQMLTEDIDASVRALLAGYRTIHDRTILSTELAPPSARAWWGQRLRWAQGWFEVTLRHQGAIVRSPRLSGELKLYWTYLLGWRELFPLLSLQIFALLLADALLGRPFTWFSQPFLLITTLVTLIAGPLAAIVTYKVALGSQRRELRRWFFIYAAGSLLYTIVKNTVALAANVRELVGQRSWIVTSRSGATVLALILVLVATSAPGARAAETATLGLGFPGSPAMTLTGRAPVTTFSLAVPNDWKTVRGTLRLGWRASSVVAANSTIGVRVGGTPVAAAPLRPGVGSLTVPIAPQPLPGHRLVVEVDGQLHTRIDSACCVPDPATGAIVTLDASSTSVTVVGTRASSPPQLADLPGSLVDVLGLRATPLYVALPARPDAAAVRAGMLVAGAVARATSLTTVPIKVVLGASPTALQTLPGQVVRVLPYGGPRVGVGRRPDGRLIVTVAGRGDGVVSAAWALARPIPTYLAGSRAQIAGVLSPGGTAAPTAAPISSAGGEGTGPLQMSADFRLPESRELTNAKAQLQLDIGFSAPAGGRIDIGLNGLPLASRNLPPQGPSQLQVLTDLVRDAADVINGGVLSELAPGDNFLTIHGSLPPGQPVGGSGDAQAPQVRILPTSVVRFTSRPRSGLASLDLWPWPYSTAGRGAMSAATFVLPKDPTPSELAWATWTVAEASRWTAAPAAPNVAIGPATLPAGDDLVLTRGLIAPVALPAGAPALPQHGLLETYASHGRQLLVAWDVRALRPLAVGYYVGRLKGVAAVVAPSGALTTLVPTPPTIAFVKAPLPWEGPVAILVLVALVVFARRIRRARRRLEALPAPAPLAPVDEAVLRAELDGWERLAAADGNGSAPHDAQTRS